jgi:hypothetical protein
VLTAESTDEAEAQVVFDRAHDDPVYFSSLCRTPYGQLPSFPFFTNLVLDFASGEDVIVAKSRQMMATWAASVTLLWRLMFTEGYAAGLTSRKERLVDDGGDGSTVNSLFGRIRHLYRSLPECFRAGARVEFSYLRATCLATGSYLVGEGATPDIFRGSTLDNALGDEWAFVGQSRSAYASVRQACRRGLWLLSTPFGSEGSFFDVWDDTPASFRKRRLHWTEHELRYSGEVDAATGRPTSDWYRGECEKLILPDSIARELDIDFSGSASGLVFPEFSIERHVRSDIRYDPELPLHFGMDFGIGAATAAIAFQVHPTDPIKVRVIADYEKENLPASTNAANLLSVLRMAGFSGQPSEVHGHGDPAGNSREISSGSTVIREYWNFGFTTFTTRRLKQADGIRLVRKMLLRGEIAFSPECEMVPKRIANYRYPTDDSGKVKGDEPVKNEATHLCDAIRYGLTGVFPVDDSGVAPKVREPKFGEKLRDVPDPSDYARPIMRFPPRF